MKPLHLKHLGGIPCSISDSQTEQQHKLQQLLTTTLNQHLSDSLNVASYRAAERLMNQEQGLLFTSSHKNDQHNITRAETHSHTPCVTRSSHPQSNRT